jgi:PAS domain S-box-containing protein
VVAFLAWQRRSVNASKELFFLMLATGIGSFCLIFETANPSLIGKIFWSKLEYIGGVTTPVLYLIFVLRYTGKEKFISFKNVLTLFLIPVITLILVFTNEHHNLIWSGYSAISKKTNLMEYYHGIGFWIGYITYTYVMLLLATFYLIQFIISHSKPFRSQGWAVLTGGLFPWLASVIYLAGINPVPGLDLTPVSITLSGILAAYAIFYTNFLDLAPLAHKTLFETLTDGIIALDEQHRILDINGAALDFLGIQNKNIIGLPAESSGAASTILLQAVVDDNTHDQLDIPNGERIKTYNIIKQPIRKYAGNRLVVIRDITNFKRAMLELNESEIKYRELVENSPDAIAIYTDGKIVFVNNECLRLMGASSASELIGKPVIHFVHPDYRGLVIERMKKSVIEGNVLPLVEEKFVRLDGSVVDVEVKAIPIRFRNQAAVQLIVNDISERNLAKEALLNERSLLRTIIDIIPDAIYVKDTERRKILANPKEVELSGKKFEYEVLGKTDIEIFTTFEENKSMEEDLSVLKSGISFLDMEGGFIDNTGKNHWLLGLKVPLKNVHGEIIGIVGLNHDITARKISEQLMNDKNEELQKHIIEKDKFFSIIAHDLRSPFHGLLGLTQLMKDELRDLTKEDLQNIAVSLNNAAINIYGLIENLLEWSLLQRGIIYFIPKSYYLLSKFESNLASVFESANKKGVKISFEIPDDTILFADENMLSSIIRNIVGNAVKFTPKGGNIIVRAKTLSDKKIEISVKDSGIGMSEELLGKLFQLDGNTSRKGTEGEASTGLGLIICKDFVEKHGGKIWAESVEGKGSTFYFTIPV